MLAQEIKSGLVICLSGELGSGKTTFIQGFLQGLKIKGHYTSPTFVIMKYYKRPAYRTGRQATKDKRQEKNMSHVPCPISQDVYHMDAYRIKEKDILSLGWEEMIQANDIVLVEWAERIKKIIPANSLWINFKWISENEREIIFLNK